jgi:peptidoglycan hydrolase CwlO-like protein
MKKILSFLIIGALVFSILLVSLSGCFLKDSATELAEDVKNSYDNVVEEAGEVYEDLKEKKEKAEETIEDIQNAAEEVEEAANAIKEITE